MKSKIVKREEAEIRQENYNLLTPQQKLRKLDQKFGKDQGAQKERTQLLKIIDGSPEKRKRQEIKPYSDFEKTAKVLDWKRLGKQRVEAKQILDTISALKQNNLYIITKTGKRRKRGWTTHPAVLMWVRYEDCLRMYHNIIICEWIDRGYNNNMKFESISRSIIRPYWLGDGRFHASHRSNLLRKNYEWYSQFGWTEPNNLEYIWP
jgi:hypothetical protein